MGTLGTRLSIDGTSEAVLLLAVEHVTPKALALGVALVLAVIAVLLVVIANCARSRSYTLLFWGCAALLGSIAFVNLSGAL